MPVTSPEVELMVATAGLPLVHVPPGMGWLKVEVPLWQAEREPVIGLSNVTVIARLVLQPDGNVYVIVSTPAETLVTRPVVALTVAIAGLLLVHVPPGAASLSEVVAPRQNVAMPVMGANAFTVRFLIA